jgi:hypothetical protein
MHLLGQAFGGAWLHRRPRGHAAGPEPNCVPQNHYYVMHLGAQIRSMSPEN